MSYDYEGTTIDGIDAAWCDNIADTKVYSESEFDLINLDKELSFIEKGEPYISVPFTEGSSSDYKHCHIEGGTIYGFKDGIGLTTLQKSPVVIPKSLYAERTIPRIYFTKAVLSFVPSCQFAELSSKTS